MALGDNIVVGLDVGTSKVRAVVGEFGESGQLEITGVGLAQSTGLRRGVVVNIESTLKNVAQAIEAAELMSGREVESVYASISGTHIEGLNSRGVVAVTGRGREITPVDVDRVIEAARAVVIPMDREVIHVLPQSYVVDDQKGIKNPLDMIGVRLECEVHIVSCSVSSAQNLVKCINRASFRVDGLVFGCLAAARSAMSSDEKELGALLIDLGAGTTDILAYRDGAPCMTSVIPVGGAQVTQDLSIVLNAPVDTAEKIKVQAGCAWPGILEEGEEVIVPGVGGRPPQAIPRAKVASIIEPRMTEIFAMAKERLARQGLDRLGGGIVLTGGGALMPGVCELANHVFGLQARIGAPLATGGLVDEYRSPVFATAVGLVQYGAELSMAGTGDGERKERKKGSALSRLGQWLKKEFF